MPRVLIIGATGYLGNNLAALLVRSGQHTVYGLARTPEKAKQLARQEIIPVICPDPINESSTYLDVIRSARIDVVVDVASANLGSHTLLRDIKRVGQGRLNAYRDAGIKGPKLRVFYLLLGHVGSRVVFLLRQ